MVQLRGVLALHSQTAALAAGKLYSVLKSANAAQRRASTLVPELCLNQTLEAGKGNLVVIWKLIS